MRSMILACLMAVGVSGCVVEPARARSHYPGVSVVVPPGVAYVAPVYPAPGRGCVGLSQALGVASSSLWLASGLVRGHFAATPRG